ncbi:MAG: hypothetical protein VB078_00330 [Clostridiaceae bacterium]|nr:hypothetical protein [Clostridiaceae bacterium]
MNNWEPGDILFNSCFGDLWLVSFTQENTIVLINDGLTKDANGACGFVKIGHIEQPKGE